MRKFVVILIMLVMSCASWAQDTATSTWEVPTVMIPDRPGLGDSPFLIEPGHIQFESSFNLNDMDGYYALGRMCPISGWELRGGYTNLYGIGKTVFVGSKFKLFEQKGLIPYTSFNVYADIPTPKGDYPTSYRALISAQHTFLDDKFIVGGNAGFRQNDLDGEDFIWSALTIFTSGDYTILAEVYSKYYSYSYENDINYDFGLGYKVASNFQIDVSAIHETNWFGAIGIAWMIPKR